MKNMKKIVSILLAAALAAAVSGCASRVTEPAADTADQAQAQETTPPPMAIEEDTEVEVTPAPMAIEVEPASEEASAETASGETAAEGSASGETVSVETEGWADAYLEFLDNNYDIIAALWPEGLGGAGFIDLDLDGTPEMLLFDQGASAALGAHLFDLADGIVYCVSSGNDQAGGAFGDEYMSDVSIWANYYESFILSDTEDGWLYWVDSGNGEVDYTWDEIIRFESVDGVLKPVSVCTADQECDPETGEITSAEYTVNGEACDEQTYNEARAFYADAPTSASQPAGVFLWDDIYRYDVTYEGLMAMAEDAAALYEPPTLG